MFHHYCMGDVLPLPPLEDVARWADVPEHASRLMSCFQAMFPSGSTLSRSIADALTELLDVAMTAASELGRPKRRANLSVVAEGGCRDND